jgi:hypothetical protein
MWSVEIGSVMQFAGSDDKTAVGVASWALDRAIGKASKDAIPTTDRIQILHPLRRFPWYDAFMILLLRYGRETLSLGHDVSSDV